MNSDSQQCYFNVPPLPQNLQNLQGWLWLIGAGFAVWVIWKSKFKRD